ncbi:hypothetical protein KG089_05230 [Carnobacteriaceae bacterium zg-ZUI252]|nr:hypothetical protein [Carnobacteriaceae bacterium zg-ZUI252]
MENPKRPRGRPATGRQRTKMLGARFTDEEIKVIKELAKKNNMTIPDFILYKIQKVD